MNRIIKIGMDVHSTNYTLCAVEPTIGAEDRFFGEIQVSPDYKEIISFIKSLMLKLGSQDNYSIEGGMPRVYAVPSADQCRDQMHHSGTDDHAHNPGEAHQNRQA